MRSGSSAKPCSSLIVNFDDSQFRIGFRDDEPASPASSVAQVTNRAMRNAIRRLNTFNAHSDKTPPNATIEPQRQFRRVRKDASA